MWHSYLLWDPIYIRKVFFFKIKVLKWFFLEYMMIVTPWNQNLCMASFDISNMYTNIPTDQLPDIISILCNHYNIDPQLRSEILHLCKVVLSQNYFTFLSSAYHQHNGLAMGAPTSSIFFRKFTYNIQKIHNCLIFWHDTTSYPRVLPICRWYSCRLQFLRYRYTDCTRPIQWHFTSTVLHHGNGEGKQHQLTEYFHT